MERIKESAISLYGIIWTGRRHHDIIRALARAGFKTPIKGRQGFVTESGEFVDRRQALPIAEAAGQLVFGTHGRHGELYSEDLY